MSKCIASFCGGLGLLLALTLGGCSHENPRPLEAKEQPATSASGDVSTPAPAAAKSKVVPKPGPTTASTSATRTPAPKVETTPDKDEPTTGVVVFGTIKLPDGSPASGTSVSLGIPDATTAMRMQLKLTDSVTTMTGADGKFRLVAKRSPMRQMPLIIVAARPQSATAYMMAESPVWMAQQQAAKPSRRIERDITLPPAAPVRGRVVDSNDKPVSGLKISAMPDITPTMEAMTAPLFRDEAVSAADGAFDLATLAAGSYTLTVESDEWPSITQTVTAPEGNLVIRVARGTASISGGVFSYSTREGVAGASVTLQLVRESKNRMMMPSTKQAITDATGSFEFTGLGPGKYGITALKEKLRVAPDDSPGRSPFGNQFTLTAGETTSGVSLFLYPGHTVRGVVRERQSSAPLENATVSVAYGEKVQDNSDSQGRFALQGVFGEMVQLNAELKGYTLAGNSSQRFSGYSQPTVRLSMKDLEPFIIIDMTKSITISGTVKSDSGKPISGADVSAYTSDSYNTNGPKVQSDADGKFEIAVKPFVSLRLKAEMSGYPPAISDAIEVLDESLTGKDITMKPGVTISGRVLTPDKKPAPDAAVSVYSYAQLSSTSYHVPGGTAKADADGKFTVENVQPTNVMLSAKLKGFADSEIARADLSSGEPKSDIELILKKTHYIAGKVTGPDDKPLSGANIYAYSNRGGSSGNVQTDAEGKYRLEDLGESTYNVNVNSTSGSDYRQNVKVDQDNVDFQIGKKKATTGKEGSEKTFIGHVVDWKTNAPVPDFTISGTNTQGAEKVPSQPGTFIVKSLREGNALGMVLEAPGYLPLDTGWIDTSKTEQTFKLGPGGTITGRAVDKDKNPIKDVRILLRGVGEDWDVNRRSPSKVARTGDDGRFTLERVEAGKNKLNIKPTPPLVDQDKTADVKHGEIADLGDIVLTGGARVNGKVLQSPGDSPIVGTRVSLYESQSGGNTKETKTDEQGAFTFENLKAAQYNVSVPDYSLNTSFAMTSEQTREVVLRVGGTTVRGRVLRGEAPVQASVSLGQPDGNNKNTQTDGDGKFEFKGAVAGTWQLSAYAYGNGQSGQVRETIEVPATGELEKDLLFPSGKIVGRVEDAEGNPVAAARVSAQPPAGSGAFDSFIPQTAAGQSQDDGSFTLEGLKPGTYGITARKDSKMAVAQGVQVPNEGESSPVVLKLGAGGGKIVSTALSMADGSPIKEAWLLLSNENGRFDHGQRRGDDGVLTVENVPAGNYNVQVSSFGFSINEHKVEVKEGETSKLDDVLYDAGAVRWRILDKSGAPVVKGKCSVVPDDPSSIETPRNGETATDGLFVVRGMFPGTYTGTVTTPTGQTATEKLAVVAHEAKDVTTTVP